VTLLGQAGTGKTLLALASGLTLVLDQKRYTEIIMTRVTVPLGARPGSETVAPASVARSGRPRRAASRLSSRASRASWSTGLTMWPSKPAAADRSRSSSLPTGGIPDHPETSPGPSAHLDAPRDNADRVRDGAGYEDQLVGRRRGRQARPRPASHARTGMTTDARRCTTAGVVNERAQLQLGVLEEIGTVECIPGCSRRHGETKSRRLPPID
jgi:hypothetical protein